MNSGQAKKEFGINGAEIVSADSRQVYKGMDIGTGKITQKEMRGVPHHLLNVVPPRRERFTVAQYQKLALKAIKKIQKKNKIPFLVGGSGFYIQAVVDGILIPKVKPDWKLRAELEKKSAKELFSNLKKLDPERARNIDRNNRRRLIRALEIVIKTKRPVPSFKKISPRFEVLMLGVKKEKKELNDLIKKRLLKRLKLGMVAEVKKLRKAGLSWKRLEEFGLEYRFIAQYLFTLPNFSKKNLRGREKINYQEMVVKLQKEIEHFAKRQMTWFRRDPRIHWIKNYKEAENLVKKELSSL